MTTETTKGTGAKSMSFYATDEDQDRIAAIATMLRGRGHRIAAPGVSAVISYALARIFLTECTEDGSLITDRNAA